MNGRYRQLRFECTGCGRCCFGGDDDYVLVNTGEAEAIRRHLGLSRSWFRRRYLVRLEDDVRYGIALRAGRCVFLGADLRCSIYSVRPVQCRTYPFWPELVESARAWRREAKRCEGIGRGDGVEVSFVARQLQRQKKAESVPV